MAMIKRFGTGKENSYQIKSQEVAAESCYFKLIMEPKMILADDNRNLDSKTGTEIMELLKTLNEEKKNAMCITHEADIAKYGKRVIHVRDGKVI